MSYYTFDRRYADNVHKRIGLSVVKDSLDGDLILKMVNMLPVKVEMDINNPLLADKQFKAEKTVLSGRPEETMKSPIRTQVTVTREYVCELSPYSFTIIRIKR